LIELLKSEFWGPYKNKTCSLELNWWVATNFLWPFNPNPIMPGSKTLNSTQQITLGRGSGLQQAWKTHWSQELAFWQLVVYKILFKFFFLVASQVSLEELNRSRILRAMTRWARIPVDDLPNQEKSQYWIVHWQK